MNRLLTLSALLLLPTALAQKTVTVGSKIDTEAALRHAGRLRFALDVTDPGTLAWLRVLVWPEHEDRLARLDAALRLAAAVALGVGQAIAADLGHEALAIPAGRSHAQVGYGDGVHDQCVGTHAAASVALASMAWRISKAR